MVYLSNLDPTSRAFMLLLLSIACVELATFAFWRIRRLLCEVQAAWRFGRMALQLRHDVREQEKQVQIDQLTQQWRILATMDLNGGKGPQEDDELDATKMLDALERLLAD